MWPIEIALKLAFNALRALGMPMPDCEFTKPAKTLNVPETLDVPGTLNALNLNTLDIPESVETPECWKLHKLQRVLASTMGLSVTRLVKTRSNTRVY